MDLSICSVLQKQSHSFQPSNIYTLLLDNDCKTPCTVNLNVLIRINAPRSCLFVCPLHVHWSVLIIRWAADDARTCGCYLSSHKQSPVFKQLLSNYTNPCWPFRLWIYGDFGCFYYVTLRIFHVYTWICSQKTFYSTCLTCECLR